MADYHKMPYRFKVGTLVDLKVSKSNHW